MNLRSDEKKRDTGRAEKKRISQRGGGSKSSSRRRTEGGSFGRKDTATVRRYKTILFLPASTCLLFFFHSFCAGGILNWPDNIICDHMFVCLTYFRKFASRSSSLSFVVLRCLIVASDGFVIYSSPSELFSPSRHYYSYFLREVMKNVW